MFGSAPGRDSSYFNLIIVLATEPGSAIRIVLFLPDRHDLLDPLNRVPASLECGVAVGRGNADDDASFPDCECADAVNNGHTIDTPAFPNLVADLRHGQLGGRRIRFVFEMCDRLSAAVVAHGPDERCDGTGPGMSNQRLR